MGMVSIDKAYSDRREISIDPCELRAKKDSRSRWIIPRQLDDLDVTSIVQDKKMRRRSARLFVSDIGIDLERTRSPIVYIIERDLRPTHHELADQNQQERDHHPASDEGCQ
jgi:hypothetical protein